MEDKRPGSSETVELAGGCFWGMQQLLRRIHGVIDTEVGYAGGQVKNATYRNHEGHAEAVRAGGDTAADKRSYHADQPDSHGRRGTDCDHQRDNDERATNHQCRV